MTVVSSQRGFTLVEVLIAVSVFAILAGSVYLALSSLADAAFVHRERSEELAELQLTLARLEADLRQLTSRPIRTEDGGLKPALVGEHDRFEATRAGWGNPQGQRRSQLQRFAWRIVGEELVRGTWPVTDRASAANAQDEPALAAVRELRIEYRGHDGRWLEQWPAEASVQVLPAALRYRLESARFGRIERVVVL